MTEYAHRHMYCAAVWQKKKKGMKLLEDQMLGAPRGLVSVSCIHSYGGGSTPVPCTRAGESAALLAMLQPHASDLPEHPSPSPTLGPHPSQSLPWPFDWMAPAQPSAPGSNVTTRPPLLEVLPHFPLSRAPVPSSQALLRGGARCLLSCLCPLVRLAPCRLPGSEHRTRITGHSR